MADDEGGPDDVVPEGDGQPKPLGNDGDEVDSVDKKGKPKRTDGTAKEKPKTAGQKTKRSNSKTKKDGASGKTDDDTKPRSVHDKCTAPETYEKPKVKMPRKRVEPRKVKKQPCCHEFCNSPKSDPANYPKGYPWSSGLLKCLPGYCKDHKEASEEEQLATQRAFEDAERNYGESVEKCRRKEQQSKIDEAAGELRFFFRLLYLTNHPDLVVNFKKKLEENTERTKKDASKPEGGSGKAKKDKSNTAIAGTVVSKPGTGVDNNEAKQPAEPTPEDAVVPSPPIEKPTPDEPPVAESVPAGAPAIVPVPPEAPAIVPVPPEAPAIVPVPPDAPAIEPVPPEAPAIEPVPPEAPAIEPVPPEPPAIEPVPPEEEVPEEITDPAAQPKPEEPAEPPIDDTEPNNP